MKARLSSVCFHFILHPPSFVSEPCPTIQNSHDVLSTRTTYVHHLVLVGELLGKALSVFEIIEEVLDGDARAVEARSAAHPFGVSPDEMFEFYFFLWCNSRHDSSYLVADQEHYTTGFAYKFKTATGY